MYNPISRFGLNRYKQAILFNAQVQSLTTEADTQTGRLQIRAKVLSNATELRPNLMVNV